MAIDVDYQPLQQLFLDGCRQLRKKSALQEAVESYLHGEVRSLALVKKSPTGEPLSLPAYREQLELLLASLLIGSGNTQSSSTFSHNRWPQNQYLSALERLCRVLSGEELAPAGEPQLTESGAALFDCRAYAPEGKLPLMPLHAELVALWSLLALLEGKPWLDAAERGADWQLQLLDGQFRPMAGLFSHEADASLPSLLAWNGLAYELLSRMTGCGKRHYLAQEQRRHLEALTLRQKQQIPPLAVLIDGWLQSGGGLMPAPEPVPFSLQEELFDPFYALVGWRSKQLTICTAFSGEGTGLGALAAGEFELLTYAVQELPFGSSGRFGIDAAPSEIHRFSRFKAVRGAGGGFSAESTVKVGPNLWIEVKQIFSLSGQLEIELLATDPEAIEQLAFAFYLKAPRCFIGTEELPHRSLNRYQGAARTARFTSVKGTLTVEPPPSLGKMEVIPLAGECGFWGADYLLGFPLKKGVPRYRWIIG